MREQNGAYRRGVYIVPLSEQTKDDCALPQFQVQQSRHVARQTSFILYHIKEEPKRKKQAQKHQTPS
jgi:hypothetical protein